MNLNTVPGRECNICPSWVSHCAHFDGNTLAIGDAELQERPPGFFHVGKRYALVDPRLVVNTEHMHGYLGRISGLFGQFDTEADAIAAFEAGVARLLDREVAS